MQMTTGTELSIPETHHSFNSLLEWSEVSSWSATPKLRKYINVESLEEVFSL